MAFGNGNPSSIPVITHQDIVYLVGLLRVYHVNLDQPVLGISEGLLNVYIRDKKIQNQIDVKK